MLAPSDSGVTGGVLSGPQGEAASSSRKKLRPLDRDVAGVVITVSTACATGKAPDKSGPRAVELLARHRVVCPPPLVVEDCEQQLQRTILRAVEDGARLVLTTGGTGVTRGDITPQACLALVEQRLWAIETQILLRGLENTPLAALSRGIVGIIRQGADRGAVLVNAPGSRGGVSDAISVVGPLFPHLLEQLDNPDY